jgi:hypothetical protein
VTRESAIVAFKVLGRAQAFRSFEHLVDVHVTADRERVTDCDLCGRSIG